MASSNHFDTSKVILVQTVDEAGDYVDPSAGGGGGSLSATATAATPTYTEGLTTAPLSVDLDGALRTTILDATGTAVDWNAAVTVSIAAGTNNIGDVDVLSLPALPAGTNNIGDVDVLSLPALPAGTNNIGDVDVLTLPALPAGTNNIGDVDVLGAVTTAAPTYTNGTSNVLSLNTTGGLRVENQTGAGATIFYQGTNADNVAAASGLTSQVVNAVGRLFDGTDFSRVRTISGSFSGGHTTEGLQAIELAGSPSTYISTATTTTVKSGAGILHKILIGTGGAGSNAVIYDNTTATGTILATIDTATRDNFVLDLQFSTGLTIVTASGTPALITVVYR